MWVDILQVFLSFGRWQCAQNRSSWFHSSQNGHSSGIVKAFHKFLNEQNRSKRFEVIWTQRKSRSIGRKHTNSRFQRQCCEPLRHATSKINFVVLDVYPPLAAKPLTDRVVNETFGHHGPQRLPITYPASYHTYPASHTASSPDSNLG